MELYDNSTILVPTSNTSILDNFATVAPDVEPTHGTSVRDTFARLAPNVKHFHTQQVCDTYCNEKWKLLHYITLVFTLHFLNFHVFYISHQ